MENDYDSRVMAADEWHISEHLRMTTRTAEEQKERLHALDQGSFIYGFCGFIGSGKNTAASFLLEKRTRKKVPELPEYYHALRIYCFPGWRCQVPGRERHIRRLRVQ